MGSTKSGTRNVPRDFELTPEFKRTNYTETIERMKRYGICTDATAQKMLARVDVLVGEGSE